MFGSNNSIEDVREELDNIFKTPESKYPQLIDLHDENAPDSAIFDAMNINPVHDDHDTLRALSDATKQAEYGEKQPSYYREFIGRAGVALNEARKASLQR